MRVYRDGVLIGTAVADKNNLWTLSNGVVKLPDGFYAFTATAFSGGSVTVPVGAKVVFVQLWADSDIGYLIMDLDQDVSQDVKRGIAALPTSIKTRILF